MRRAPKYVRFFLFGAAAGAVISLVSAAPLIGTTPSTNGIPVIQVVGFFTLFIAAIGGFVGLTAALIIDVRLRRSASTASAKRTDTRR